MFKPFCGGNKRFAIHLANVLVQPVQITSEKLDQAVDDVLCLLRVVCPFVQQVGNLHPVIRVIQTLILSKVGAGSTAPNTSLNSDWRKIPRQPVS